MIQTERILTHFKALVALDSPSRGERLVCDYIKTYLGALGIEVHEDNAGEAIGGAAGNLYAFIDGEVGAEPVLFSAHMDTVEPSSGKVAVIHSDGRITSDGTTVLGSDDLAGVVSLLEAVTVILENKLPHRPIELFFSVCEETYCRGANAFDFNQIKAKQAYIFDLDGEVGTAASSAPTILSYTAKFIGKSAHAGFAAHLGIHAIKAAALAVTRIPCGAIAEGVTANVGIIEGGTATNIVPPLCTVTGEIRSFDDSLATEKLDEVKSICHAAAAETGATVEIDFTRHITAFAVPEKSAVVRRFQACAKALGMSGEVKPTFGGSDCNVLAQHGINGIVTATAMNNCHSVNEYTGVSQLEAAAALALALMTAKE